MGDKLHVIIWKMVKGGVLWDFIFQSPSDRGEIFLRYC